MPQYGIIILAAGNSSRLGQPKQLLQFKNESLLFHVAGEATKVAHTFTVVVTGANNELVREQLKGLSVTTTFNENWQEGMASSIRKGLSEIIEHYPGTEGCIFTVCDQPFVSASLLNMLLEQKLTTGKGIVASAYAGTLGVPSLFDMKYFNKLLELRENEGAKKLITAYPEDVAAINFDLGVVDIDTPEDYKNLLTFPL